MSREQELEETGGDLDGVGEEGGKLHLLQHLWGCQCQASPTGAAHAGTGVQCTLPVLCLGQSCFCRGRKVKGVTDLVISLSLLGKLRDNPLSFLGFWGGNFTYKWEALDHFHHQVPTHPNCMRFEITFAGDHVRTALP